MKHARLLLAAAVCAALTIATAASSVPIRAQKGMVASSSEIASKIGADVIAGYAQRLRAALG